MPLHTKELLKLVENGGVRVDSNSLTTYSNTGSWIKLAEGIAPQTSVGGVSITDDAGSTSVFLVSLDGLEAGAYITDWTFFVTVKFSRSTSTPFYDSAGTFVTVMPLNADKINATTTVFDPTTDIVLTISSSSIDEYELWIKAPVQFKNLYAQMLGAGTTNLENSSKSGSSMRLVTGQSWSGSRTAKDNDVFGRWSSLATRYVHVRSEIATPAAPADGDGGIIYVKSDGKLYFRSHEIEETNLGTITSGDVQQLTSVASPLHIGSAGSDYENKIGIGTATPQRSLQVKFNVNNTGDLDAGLGGGTLDIGHIIVQNDNTTPGSYSALDFRSNNSDARIAAIHESTNTTDLAFILDDNAFDPRLQERMRLTSNGMLGLGTSAPDEPVHVKESKVTTGVSNSVLKLETFVTDGFADGDGPGIKFSGGDSVSADNTLGRIAAVRDGTDNEGKLVFSAGTDGAEETLTINRYGDTFLGQVNGSRVGVGVLSSFNPSNLLEIRAGMGTRDDGIVIVRDDSTTLTDDFLGGVGFNSTDGGVGGSVLDSNAYIAGYAAENQSNTASGGYITIGTAPTGKGYDDLATERLRITAGGRCGIGTSSPACRLDVNGTVRSNKWELSDYGAHQNNFASLTHIDRVGNVSTQYALLQKTTGETFLNAATGEAIRFRINNDTNTQMSFFGAGNLSVVGNVTASNVFIPQYISVTLTSDSTANGTEYNPFDEDEHASFASTTNASSGITYTQSDGRFTIGTAGVYEINLVSILESNTELTKFSLTKNGTTEIYEADGTMIHSAVDPVERTISGIFTFAANDYVELLIDGGGNVTVHNGTTMNIKRIA